MRLAVTSDIHTDVNGPELLAALVDRARELAPDVLLIIGDIATAPAHYLQTLLALRAVVPRLLVVAGNHDVWTTPEAVAKGLDSWARLDHLLPALAAEAGAELLDRAPVEIDGVAILGSLGLGELIRSDPRVVLHLAGHTHLHSDLKLGKLRALVTPLGYKREWLGATPREAVHRSMKLLEL